MPEKIRMIVSDLDGTLLDSTKTISQFTEETLINFQKEGCTVVLASGRYQREVLRYAEQLHLKDYNGWIVCANGYEVTRMSDGEVHTFDAISAEEGKKLCKLADGLKLLEYIKINGSYHLKISKPLKGGLNAAASLLKTMQAMGYQKGTYTTHLLDETIYVHSMNEVLNNAVYKICFIGSPNRLKKLIELVERIYPNRYAFYYVNPMAVEICRSTVSKRHAINYICKQLDMSLDNVIAFGDSGNDEPLLKEAGIGITMKNGTRKALAAAKMVSDKTNNEDGVAVECLKWIGGYDHD